MRFSGSRMYQFLFSSPFSRWAPATIHESLLSCGESLERAGGTSWGSQLKPGSNVFREREKNTQQVGICNLVRQLGSVRKHSGSWLVRITSRKLNKFPLVLVRSDCICFSLLR